MSCEIEKSGDSAETMLSECLDGRWWVAHTRPRAEKALSADLDRFAIPNYLPLHKRVTRSRATNRISRSMAPVFSGYLFFAATEAQRCQSLTTNRIVSILTVPNQARLVAELRQIQQVLASDADFAQQPRIEVGRWVRIVDGPLVGVIGVVSSRRSPHRVFLNVDILGQSITVETAPGIIEPIDPPSYTDDSRVVK